MNVAIRWRYAVSAVLPTHVSFQFSNFTVSTTWTDGLVAHEATCTGAIVAVGIGGRCLGSPSGNVLEVAPVDDEHAASSSAEAVAVATTSARRRGRSGRCITFSF
jgi:hypothetical protein